MEIQRSEEFNLAYRFITETDCNIFLTGKAGTGKTTFLKFLLAHCNKKAVVAAPTGVAAINAGGVTLHSLFQLPFGPFIPTEEEGHQLLAKARFHKEKLNLLRNIELLIIDEASMVAMHTVDAIDTILRSVRRKQWLPFGGVQVLFIGDLHQLQPVVKNEELNLLEDYYSSVFFFDSLVLRKHPSLMIELKHIYRQKDEQFIRLLNEVRHNELTEENIALLNSRLNRNFSSSSEDGYITLTTHNYQSDRINKTNLDKLSTRTFHYKAEVAGEFPENMFPADTDLGLRTGAQVMFLKNDNENRRYFNGKLGIITHLSDEEVWVRCQGESEQLLVSRHEWKNIRYSFNAKTRELSEEELGTFTQYPLRLAWAITIHKSQGLTFDKLIIDSENAFANGQVYVALSRATSLEGLVLTSPINRRFLGAQGTLTEWQENNLREDLPSQFDSERNKYILKELTNSFSWGNLLYLLNELSRTFDENKEAFSEECFSWLEALKQQQKAIQDVAEKFKERIKFLARENEFIEQNAPLQQRTRDAAVYFFTEQDQWRDKLHAHPLAVDTRKSAKPLDKILESLNIAAHEILHRMEYCKSGFQLDEFLRRVKKFSGNVKSIRSVYGAPQKVSVVEKTQHPQLYQRLAAMRKGLADEENLPLYQVFTNEAMRMASIMLPGNKTALLEVRGFGKKKVHKYGEAVLKIIREYCEDHNLLPQELIREEVPKKSKQKQNITSTVEQSLSFHHQGKTVHEIASLRNLAVSTIEGHLALGIKSGKIHLEEFISEEEAEKIASHFPPELEDIYLSSIKEKLPDVSFGKLRMVLAWLQAKHQS